MNVAFTIQRLEHSKVHSNPEHSLMHYPTVFISELLGGEISPKFF